MYLPIICIYLVFSAHNLMCEQHIYIQGSLTTFIMKYMYIEYEFLTFMSSDKKNSYIPITFEYIM